MTAAYLHASGAVTRHTHEDDALTIGCPACILRARDAQWHGAPLHRTRWITSDRKAFIVDLPVPDGERNTMEVTRVHGPRTAVIDAINATGADMNATWWCTDIGPEVPAEAPTEHPSLFGGAA